MIASLPMYSRPETAAACGRLWSLIRDGLRSQSVCAPQALSRPHNLLDHWRDRRLLLSQTCGRPLMRFLTGHVHMLGTPDPGHRGCPAGHYFSFWIKARADRRTRLEDFSGAALAFNDRDSLSGWKAPMDHALSRRVTFENLIECGSHREAARAVAEGQADIAAIDAHSWKLTVRFDRFASDLNAFDRTHSSPALPLITGQADLVLPLKRAVEGAIAALNADDRELTACHGLIPLTQQHYCAAGERERPAA